jgi:hypothetical protein
MRHKHADLIHAWAEGAEIEIYDTFVNRWNECSYPSFCHDLEYRIKPKPDVVKHYYKYDDYFQLCYKPDCTDTHDLRCTFDGETGELKSAEVIK